MEAEDHEGISEELEEEEELLSQLVDAVGHLLKLYGPQFMPVFDQLVVPAFAPYLAAEQPEALQAIAVCLIDDALEFGGVDSAAKYYPQALVTFARTMKSEDIVLRQSSVYGLAQIARLAPQVLAPQGAPPLPSLPLLLLSTISHVCSHSTSHLYSLSCIPFLLCPHSFTYPPCMQPSLISPSRFYPPLTSILLSQRLLLSQYSHLPHFFPPSSSIPTSQFLCIRISCYHHPPRSS